MPTFNSVSNHLEEVKFSMDSVLQEFYNLKLSYEQQQV